jgi:RNA recognition motif-containing protein
MDRRRNNPNRNRPLRNRLIPRKNNRRALLDRRNRRQGLNRNRNRLFRAQNNINRNNQRGPNRNRRRYNNFRTRRNPNYRIIFVANLPFNVDNRLLRDLFRREGRITQSKIVYGNNGSKGYGFIEFYNPRDAWRSIQRWNNTMLGGRKIVVQYRKRRRFNNRGFNNNYQRYNQQRGGFGYRRGNRGGFRPRGNRY